MTVAKRTTRKLRRRKTATPTGNVVPLPVPAQPVVIGAPDPTRLVVARDIPRIEVNDEGDPLGLPAPTRPLELHKLAIFELMVRGCRPAFIRGVHDWLKSGCTAPVLMYAETPAEASVLDLVIKHLEKGGRKVHVATKGAL